MRSRFDKKDRYLRILMLVIVMGYIFFLTSKYWLPPDEATIPPTEPGTSVEGNDRSITLVSWIYDEEKREMEVMLDITNMSIDGINRYSYRATELNKGRLPVTTVIEADDFAVIRLGQIPRRFEEISLRIGIRNEDETKVDGEFTDIRIYGSKESVKKADITDGLTERDYRISACQERIAVYEKNISELEKQIAGENVTISEAEKTIKRLEENTQHQTESEIASTNSVITEISGKIDTAKNNIKEYEKQIEELKEKITLQEEVESEL